MEAFSIKHPGHSCFSTLMMSAEAWDIQEAVKAVTLSSQLGTHFPRELLSVCHRERSGLPGWVGLVVLLLLAVDNTHT
jgi:hypothetical protein